MNSISRRRFFFQSAGIGMALAASQARGKGVNEQLNVGFIGLGGRGNELLGHFSSLPDVRIAALCDPDEQRLSTVAANYKDANAFADLRRLLDDPGVDAVAIATCNHWHALAAIWACQAGKDVYVEKPLSHSHWEGQQVVRAARKHDRIVQVGMQQRSDPLQDSIKDFLHVEQPLGPIQYVQVCRFGKRLPIGNRTTPLAPPKSLDYDLWLGPALDEPIYRDQLHYDWHWDWNTGSGEMGNWGIHVLDDAINVVLRDQPAFPQRIAAAGGRVVWNDAGQSPNVSFAYYDTGTTPILFALSNLEDQLGSNARHFSGMGSGYIIQCEGGSYAGGRGGGTAHDRPGNLVRSFAGDSGAGHARNFVDAVFAHDRSKLNAEVEIGHRSTAWCNLANIAVRLGQPYEHAAAAAQGRPRDAWGSTIDVVEEHLASHAVSASEQLRLSPLLEFDESTETFIGENAATANNLLRREYRPQFEVPAIA
jgi:Oxidoreductase family, NAD-binding Rossmann fold/Oxidoreductase family, C-terminal alpha/beta domain